LQDEEKGNSLQDWKDGIKDNGKIYAKHLQRSYRTFEASRLAMVERAVFEVKRYNEKSAIYRCCRITSGRDIFFKTPKVYKEIPSIGPRCGGPEKRPEFTGCNSEKARNYKKQDCLSHKMYTMKLQNALRRDILTQIEYLDDLVVEAEKL